MKLRVIYFFLLLVPSFACEALQELETIDAVRHEAAYAFPLVNTDLRLEDFLDAYRQNGTLEMAEDGLLSFSYREEVFSQSGKDLLEEISAGFPKLIPVPEKITVLPAGLAGGIVFDRLDIAAGKLGYSFASAQRKPVTVVIRFPNIESGGQVLQFSHTLPAWSGTGAFPVHSATPFDLSGYRILTPDGQFAIQYTATDADGVEVPLENFIVSFQDLIFSLAQGYLGQLLLQGDSGRLELDFFENRLNGEIAFASPRISLIADNGIGLPSRIGFDRFDVIGSDGTVKRLESQLTDGGVEVAYPLTIGTTANSSFVIDAENSNLAALLEGSPVAVDYSMNALINPSGDTNIRGFVSDTGDYKLAMELSLPFFGSLTDFVARDTLDMDFSAFSDFDRADFKLVTDNALPLALTLQGYFVDDSYRVLAALLDNPLPVVMAAPVDPGGVTTGRSSQTTLIPFDPEKFSAIQSATRLILVATFSSANDGQAVKIFDHQDLAIRMGVILSKFNQ